MHKLKLVAFDPGLTTGYAVYQCNSTGKAECIDAGDFQLWNGIEEVLPGKDYCIVEDFVFNPGVNTIAKEIIGIIRYHCSLWGIGFELKRPMKAEQLPPQYRMPGVSIHANSATLHGLVHLIGKGYKVVAPNNDQVPRTTSKSDTDREPTD